MARDSSEPQTLKQLAGDLGILLRNELELARREMAQKAISAGVGAGMLSGAALTSLLALASLTALIVIALAIVLPLWLSALIVTAGWAAVTALLALLGKKKLQDAAPFVPEQTIADVKEDFERVRRNEAPPLRED